MHNIRLHMQLRCTESLYFIPCSHLRAQEGPAQGDFRKNRRTGSLSVGEAEQKDPEAVKEVSGRSRLAWVGSQGSLQGNGVLDNYMEYRIEDIHYGGEIHGYPGGQYR